jgi:hypothetical protein
VALEVEYVEDVSERLWMEVLGDEMVLSIFPDVRLDSAKLEDAFKVWRGGSEPTG